ncbi:PAS domain-containing protein [Cellulomonas cellasea]|uniref:PAS domain S-box-containing protein n=1 Tax=Cellulomonas cellasea TaxID=43670 RepID=A0A7W4UJY0_9CELL|nr:PAS domain-containing protein [Cellulomonas cellasea]MBB2925515.1 PAS domain S-box-containing protein [Cellulomonas cellasea]
MFASAPTAYLLLFPDFTIADANEAYLQVTGRTRRELVGRSVFDVFPSNPQDAAGDGVGDLRTALLRVLESGRPETMAVLRYDIPAPDGQGFLERYWSPVNAPVTDARGRIVLLVHRVVDVTEFVHHRGQSTRCTRT